MSACITIAAPLITTGPRTVFARPATRLPSVGPAIYPYLWTARRPVPVPRTAPARRVTAASVPLLSVMWPRRRRRRRRPQPRRPREERWSDQLTLSRPITPMSGPASRSRRRRGRRRAAAGGGGFPAHYAPLGPRRRPGLTRVISRRQRRIASASCVAKAEVLRALS